MFSFMCATPMGSAVAGPIYEQIGFYGTFGLSAGCTLLAFLYALIFIKETVRKGVNPMNHIISFIGLTPVPLQNIWLN